MGRKKVECQCDPPCVSAAACQQKRSRAARRAAAIALAVGAVGVALLGAAVVVAGAAALAAGSRLQTPVKRPAPPTQMAPPRKATKQRSLFETLHSPEPQAPPTVKVQDVASAVLWFRGHSAFEGDALATAWNSAQKAAAVMTPSLQVLCAKAVLPEVKFTDVVQAVLHFAACGLNDARAAAKELRAAHSINRVHCFCAVARVQAHYELPPIVPAWFPQMPPAQAPSLSVTRKVVLALTVIVNENPAAQ